MLKQSGRGSSDRALKRTRTLTKLITVVDDLGNIEDARTSNNSKLKGHQHSSILRCLTKKEDNFEKTFFVLIYVAQLK